MHPVIVKSTGTRSPPPEIFSNPVEQGLFLQADPPKQVHNLWLGSRRNDGLSLLNDPGFFPGYLFKGISQVISMVQRDISDDGKEGIDHVGRIEPPPQANFQYRQIYPTLNEIEHGHRSGEIEEGKCLGNATFPYRPSDPLSQVDNLPLRYFSVIDSHPFGEGYQVGGCIQSNAISALAQHRLDHGGG